LEAPPSAPAGWTEPIKTPSNTILSGHVRRRHQTLERTVTLTNLYATNLHDSINVQESKASKPTVAIVAGDLIGPGLRRWRRGVTCIRNWVANASESISLFSLVKTKRNKK